MTDPNSILDKVLIRLSSKDDWTAHKACEGTLITGSPGSGKSSTSAKEIAYRFLEEGYGGLVLSHKISEPEMWLEYCEKTGRSKDVILVSEDSGHCFDFLSYEWGRKDVGSGDTETLIEILAMLTGAGGATGEGKFWESAAKKLMRHVMKAIGISGMPLSIKSMNDVIQSLPKNEEEFKEEEFKEKSACAQIFKAIQGRKRKLTQSEEDDIEQTIAFLFFKWPRMAKETSGSIEMHWATLADQFLFDPFRRLFCSGKCTFFPEHTSHLFPGKVVIVGFPTLKYGETGSMINRLMKVFFQKSWLRRDVKKYPNIVFCFQDEFQTFLMPGQRGPSWDNGVQQVCRDRRIANVFITQNLLNLAEVLGEHNIEARTKSFIGNINLHIMHQQNEFGTQTHYADLIGKEWRMKGTINTDGNNSSSVGGSPELVHRVQPNEFSLLHKPDNNNEFADSIIYNGGTVFKETNLNHHRRLFSRNIQGTPFTAYDNLR